MLIVFALLSMHSRLDVILQARELRGASVSAIVQTLDGKTIFARNPAQRLIPGSNEKLISTAYALNKLGGDFKPQTRIWKTPNAIVIDAPGDPLMTDKQLEDAAHQLVDATAHLPVQVREAYHPGFHSDWEIGDLPNRYAAPVESFCFNQGGFEIWAENGQAFLLPHNFGVKVTARGGGGRAHVHYDPIRCRCTVTGQLPEKRQRLDTLSIPRPDRAAASYFGSDFQLTEALPSSPPDLTLDGKPMPEMLAKCLKPSDNLMAENLFLMAATKGQPSENPYSVADKEALDFLTDQVHVDPKDCRIVDGSGLSRHNLVTTREIATLLRWADQQPTAAIWRSSLATPGEGTLKKRLIGVPFQGKTGTLDSVVALSGYIRAKSGRTLIVSVIANGFSGPADSVREVVDRFVKNVAEQG